MDEQIDQQENMKSDLENKPNFWIKYKWWIIGCVVFLIIVAGICLFLTMKCVDKPVEKLPLNTQAQKETEDYSGILSLSPSKIEVSVDDEFKVDILMNTGGYNISVGEAILEFDSEILEIIDVDGSESVLGMKAIEKIEDGSLEIVRGEPADGNHRDKDDGFTGDAGILASITFKAKTIGTAEVKFKNNSRLILDDGKGTVMEMEFNKGMYYVK